MSNFIVLIKIKKIRHLENIDISLGEKKHLILTGKNGSGKTSVLNEIDFLLNKYIDNTLPPMIEKYYKLFKKVAKIPKKNKYNQELMDIEKSIVNIANVDIYFEKELEVCQKITDGNFILVYFKAQRQIKPNHVTTTTKLELNLLNDTRVQLNKQFLQYLVNLKTSQAFAQIRGNNNKVEDINQWFLRFESILKKLFNSEALNLIFYDETFDFKIEYEDKVFGLDELSDGYSSILAILTELILRMEAHHVNDYNVEGVVLIDEIETHLHVELQKNILPLLISFFPNIQFIVTTHSPFILSSLPNAVIYDLEKKFVTTDLSAYSYDALIESYFDSDKYSKEVKEKIEVFEKLADRDDLSDNEKEEYYKLKKYFDSLPTFRADELAVKVNEIKLRTMFKAG